MALIFIAERQFIKIIRNTINFIDRFFVPIANAVISRIMVARSPWMQWKCLNHMGLIEKLLRYLSEFRYLNLQCMPFGQIIYTIQIYGPLVTQMEKEIVCFQCLLTPLLITEYQVDPMVQIARYVFRFQGLAKNGDKLLGGVFSPGG